MAKRKSKSPIFDRAIGKAVRVPRKPKPKPGKIEPSPFFDTVEDLSSPDAKVAELIKERRREAKRGKPK